MTPIQREARIRHAAKTAHRRTLEEAVCEALVAYLRMEAGLARLHEAVAQMQARQLGVA